MSEQFLSTSRLGNVMRLIALGRQTGLLRVIRGQGASREEGEVQFIEGQIALAVVGQISGTAAISVLEKWGESAYVFLDGRNELQHYTAADNLAWGGMPSPSGSLPPAGSGSFPAGPFTGPPYRNTGQFNSYGPSPSGNYPGNGVSSTGNFPSNGASPAESYPGNGASQTGPWQAQNYPPLQADTPQRLSESHYVPRRLTNIDTAETTQLDRRERQLLLLVDNRRTVPDLIRLTRRGEEEIRYILARLIAFGLVE